MYAYGMIMIDLQTLNNYCKLLHLTKETHTNLLVCLCCHVDVKLSSR